MRRWFVVVFIFLLVSVGLFLPHWITSSTKSKKIIETAVKKELHASASFSDMTWYWFPSPHLAFTNLKINGAEFALDASNAEVYPDWLSLIAGDFGIAGLSLDDVHLIIRELRPQGEKKTTLPKWIRIKNGFLEISKGVKLPSFPFKDRMPYIRNLYGYVETKGSLIVASLKGNTRQAQKVSIEGEVDLKSLDYALKGKVEQLDLKGLKVKDVTTRKQFPSYGFLNLDLDLKGRALEWSEGKVKAYSNCFVTKSGASSAIFSCGSLDLAYKYKDGSARMELKELAFQRPRLFLKGNVELYKKENPYRIRADLSGKDFDLAQIRRALIALSIKDKDVEDYCRAVRAGQVEHATLHMDAPASKWHSLSDMYIEGRARDVRLYVKDEDFFVDSASGPFEIKDGVLYAKDVIARLRDTKGSQGSLVLGLSKGREQFKLDIQLSSPARDVKWALIKFNHDEKLHRELAHLSNLKGWLSGRLQIGDHKHDNHVRIDVKSVKLSGYYETLGMDVKISRARAAYFQDRLSITDAWGAVGPNSFDGLSGEVSWKGHRFNIKLSRGKGQLKTESVLELCRKFRLLTDFIEKKQVAMWGYLGVNRVKLDLWLHEPESMTFLFGVSPRALHIKSNLFPLPLFLKGGQMVISNSRLTARELKVKVAGDWSKLSLDFEHQRFKDWRGWLRASTVVRERMWRWFEEKGLHLDEFTPRLPFYAQDFKVEIGKDHISAFKGRLKWKPSGTEVELAGRNNKGLLDLNRIIISKGGERCLISYRKEEGKRQGLFFSFSGQLKGEVLNHILKENDLLSGRASGDFSFDFSVTDHNSRISTNGNLEVQGLKWIWSKKVDLFFETLKLDATKDVGSVKAHLKLFQDPVDVSGSFDKGPKVLKVSLKLSCPVLSSKIFSIIQESYEDEKEKPLSDKKGATHPSSANIWASIVQLLRLNLTFDIGEARYAVTDFSKTRKGNPHEIILKNLKGQAEVDGNVLEKMDVYSDDTCGLDIYLKKERLEGSFVTEFSAITPPDKTAKFEEVLDCLGIKQDLITGPLTLNLYLRGKNRVLLGNGKLKIKAKDGYIHKFGLLSKIFSVVNIVDIFSLNKGLLEGTSPYKKMLVEADIKSGKVHLEKAYIKGSGINFYGTGDVFLDKRSLNLIIFIQPLKTVDRIITSLPIIGGIIGGKNKSLFAIPVRLSGDWSDPKVDTLQTKAVTDLFKKLIFNVLTAPFSMVH